MNALVTGDWHAQTVGALSKPTEDGLSDRFHDLLWVVGQMERVIVERGVTDLILGGDLFHRRHFISFRLFNTVWDRVANLTDLVRRTVILVGNHDYEDDVHHAVHAFSALPNTLVIAQPEVVPLSDGDRITVIPYLPDPAAVALAFERADAQYPVVSHYAAEGVPLETDYWLESPVKLGELARFPLVLFHHVHRPSEQLDGRVVYVGAPMHFDFGDVGVRGAVVVKDRKWERVPLMAPQFITSRWPRVPVPPAGGGYLRLLDVPTGNGVDVRDGALAQGWRDVVTKDVELPQEARAAAEGGLAITRQTLADYVARRAPDIDGEGAEALVDDGERLLKEARG